MQIFNNPEFGSVRAVEISGEPWFVGKDVATVLGYKNPQEAIRTHVDEEDKGVSEILTPGGKQTVPIINESIRRGHVETHDDTASFYRAKRSHLGIYRAIAERDYMEAKFLVERHIWETLNDIKSKEDKS